MINFKRFFVRGLAVILPTVLTAYLIVLAYGFVNEYIAEPLNKGVRAATLRITDFPVPSDDDFDYLAEHLSPSYEKAWAVEDDARRSRLGASYGRAQQIEAKRQWMKGQEEVVLLARDRALTRKWNSVKIGSWALLDLVGLILAAVIIYIAGLLLGSFLGRSLYRQAEQFIKALPLISRVYPSVKQVTDFFFADKPASQQIDFNRVVAVQYPRKGLWSVGLVTGDTMRDIQKHAGTECLTVFIPSSPTPFTGYVITVPRQDTLDLPVTIEEALKFAVSGGVLIPPGQVIEHGIPESALRVAMENQTKSQEENLPNSA